MSLPSTPGTTGAQAGAYSPADKDRIFSLDVLRGIALLGILVISIWEFGGFNTNERTFYIAGWHGGNYKLLSAVSILFEGKMRALFALVFGAGIILFLQKKDYPSPISPADAYIRRQIWLIIFGVFNAFILLWPGDILFQYGVVGILLFAFSRTKAKGLFIAAIICTLIYCGKNYWYYADDKKDRKKYLAVMVVEKKYKADSLAREKKDSINKPKDSLQWKDWQAKKKISDSLAKKNDTLTKKQAEEKGKWERRLKGMKYDSSKTVAENKAMRTRDWGKIWDHLMVRSQNKESYWLYRFGIWDIASMMFLGMALLSIGFFSSRFSTSKYLLIGLIALAVGFAMAWWRVRMYNCVLVDYEKYISKKILPYNFLFPVERVLMCIGYVSLVVWLLRMNILQWLWEALAATGRMAFTNYMLQTVICTFFFYGYGFSYFGHMKQWELYFMVAEIALVQVIFSVCWLRYYQLGPVEWLWRCLIYKKWLPIKKTSLEKESSS